MAFYPTFIISFQYEIVPYLYTEHKITGFAKLTDIGGNGEYSTKKWIWLEMGNFLPKIQMDGYGSDRTGWSGVGLTIFHREGLYRDGGTRPRSEKFRRGRLPRFENKMAQIRCLFRFLGYFGVGWPPADDSSPHSKIRGDAPAHFMLCVN